MSSSASSNITHFFKTQRKRSRTGKEVDVSTSKKIILEESFNSSSESLVKVKNEELNHTCPKLIKAAVKTAEKAHNKESIDNKSKSVKSSKSYSTFREKKITDFVKPATSAPLTNADEAAPSLLEHKSVSEHSVNKIKQAAPSVQKHNDAIDIHQNTNIEKSEVDNPSTSKSSASPKVPGTPSPVKFLKIGALSPGKRKQLSSEQIAKLLKNKTKLSDLKKALVGINQCEQKLNDFRKTVAEANAKQVASPSKNYGDKEYRPTPTSSATKCVSPAQFYSPAAADRIKTDLERLSTGKVGSPSKIMNMANRAKKRLLFEDASSMDGYHSQDKEIKNVPAYQRLHSLIQKIPAETDKASEIPVMEFEADLILPFKFKVLKELFVACETVIGIMQGRKEIPIFPKVKAGVLELVRKVHLREKHLAQMATVLPNCYAFELVKFGQDNHIEISTDVSLPSITLARRKAFHSALIKRCLEHHQKFLSELVPPVKVPADKQITRWHPHFKLDDIPDIVPSENILPIKPLANKVSSAREVIAKAQSILEHANPKMKKAVMSLVDNPTNQESSTAKTDVVQTSAKLKALKGVSSSLLEKIRKREQEKLITEMTRTPAESRKLQMIRKLPNLIRIIRNMMVAEKKVALPMDTVIERICHSIQNMPPGEAEAHLRLLATIGSEQEKPQISHWLTIVKLSHSEAEYIRIDKNMDVNELVEEMNDIVRKHSAACT